MNSIIRFVDSDGIVHNLNPRYVVDVYKTPYIANGDWCLTIKFGKDAGINNNVYTKTFSTEKECDDEILAINAYRESINQM